MKRIKQNQGRVVYSPLSTVFDVVPVGGSYLQKYDALEGVFTPDRSLTPLVLQPKLIVSDPTGVLATGDYTTALANVNWKITSMHPGQPNIIVRRNYSVDPVTHALTLEANVMPGYQWLIHFDAVFVDSRRNEIHHFEWEQYLTSDTETNYNCSLDAGRWRHKMLLSPFKHWGRFSIPVQMKYGDKDVPDADCEYIWQWWNNNNWQQVTGEPWYVSGAQTKTLTVDQDYIQNVLLRCYAVAFGQAITAQTFHTRLIRYYGPYEEDVDFASGKYIFHDTQMVVLEAKVTNRQGEIAHPTRYFDMELFFAVGNDAFETVGYGTEAIIRRTDLQRGAPRCGIVCRQLSAFQALATDDGKVLCLDDGTPLFAQFPIG